LWVLGLFGILACGGGAGGAGPDIPGDAEPDAGPDVPDTAPPPECTADLDCQGKFQDLGPCEAAYCNGSGGGICAKKTVADGTACDDGDGCTSGETCQAGACVPAAVCECRKDADCDGKFRDLGPCEKAFCNPEVGHGTCERGPAENGVPCDDENPCTQGDSCKEGVCAPGPETVCDCMKTEDCAAMEDGDLCNGTLVCDLQQFPYRCVVDPATVVECDASADTFCLENRCEPETGECAMAPVHEGEPCEDQDVCSKSSACQAGECAPVDLIQCDDQNPCTDDRCDPVLGCIFTANEAECDDGNACTSGDRCRDRKCEPGEPVVCDNHVFCDGVETCDPAAGCKPGTPPDCDDQNPCTLDACDPVSDQCTHTQLPTAKEGPMGAATCSDDVDNDCDGLKDGQDPECQFGLTSVEPPEGPAAGGATVSLRGSRLKMAKSVKFAGVAVEFQAVSDQELTVVTPPHDPADVDVEVSTGWITFTLANAYRYTGPSAQQDLRVQFVSPAVAEMLEGQTLSGVQVTLLISGVDEADPAAYVAQVGYGLRGTRPWEDPSWTWGPLEVQQVAGPLVTYQGELTVTEGGYLEMAARVSSDGGYTFVFGDLDGSDDGYAPDGAAKLTVWGVPRPGAIVINELMWMGSNENPNLPSATFDEWIELRNMTRAPFHLDGYKVTGAAMLGADLVLDDPIHTVHNLLVEPYGYFLVSDYDRDVSMVDVQPDVVTNTKMSLTNQAPATYTLVAPGGIVLDTVKFTGMLGYNGDPALGTPDKSMERNAVPGDGRDDANWHTAMWHEGWDGDPFQKQNWGTPRGPNSDVALCTEDAACSEAFPGLEIGVCEVRACLLPLGRCTVGPRENGTPCEDGRFCTVSETCSAGECVGVPRDCADQDLCTQDSCDERARQCVNEPVNCDDQDLCTADSCDPDTGTCRNEPKDCGDADACTTDSCDPATGACVNAPVDCDDQNACTADACDPADGSCRHDTVLCGDGDPCTADSCDPDSGCVNEPIPGCTGCAQNDECADASLCTDDVCDGGACVHLPVVCDDGDPCTDDWCDDGTGQCAATPVVCDDQNACTGDSCDPATGTCVYEPVPVEDGDLCTVDSCDPATGTVSHDPRDCDDQNACTFDSCDPATGTCLHDTDPAAIEGPAGDPTCSDGVDNDCDGRKDGDDPQCLLAIQSVFPPEYPTGSGHTIRLSGGGFDIVTEVRIGKGEMTSFPFTIVDSGTIDVTGPSDPVPTGDYDVTVTDGVVTAMLADAIRVIDKDTSLWANTQWPQDAITVQVGEHTGTIYGQVYAAGITDAGGDPALIRAELGYGPRGSDPFSSPDWHWTAAAHNPQCLACGNNYEYMADLVVPWAGEYIVGFRFSVDGGFHWAYGDKDGWQNGWDPAQALGLTVNPL